MIKINDSKEYNKILTGKGVEQLQHTPLTLQENMLLCKSADSLMSSCQVASLPLTSASFDKTATVPPGETWRILAIAMYCATQALSNILVVVQVRNYETGVSLSFRYHESATGVAAGVGYQQTSMGSSGLVLQSGDAIRFTADVASSAATNAYVLFMRSPAGFATQ